MAGFASLLPSSETNPKRDITQFNLPDSGLLLPLTPAETPQIPDDWQATTIRSGDSLSTIFKRLGRNAKDVYTVANTTTQQKPLQRLRPGEQIAICLTEEGRLNKVKYTRSNLEHYLYERSETGFIGKKILHKPEIITAFKKGTIKSSLFLDASKAGLSQAKIMELANIFGWDIDFALDIRKGDTFSVLYEEKLHHGKKIGSGNILAATFSNRGKTFKAVRYEDSNGLASYYTPEGKPMRKAFLRAPLDFTRISSNFNLRRRHPIHKKIKAHRGVDYAASKGTPVYAAGDGRVMASGYNRANGNYVFIQHGGKYITKYLHLNKRSVRKGQHVAQRKVIGTVGSTGYATGAHLHYEFLVNGVHRNPRKVKLPEAEPIAQSKRSDFIAQITPSLKQLSQHNGILLAASTPLNK